MRRLLSSPVPSSAGPPTRRAHQVWRVDGAPACPNSRSNDSETRARNRRVRMDERRQHLRSQKAELVDITQIHNLEVDGVDASVRQLPGVDASARPLPDRINHLSGRAVKPDGSRASPHNSRAGRRCSATVAPTIAVRANE